MRSRPCTSTLGGSGRSTASEPGACFRQFSSCQAAYRAELYLMTLTPRCFRQLIGS